MYRVSIVLYKHEWKFGRTRKAVRTRAAGECFHSFFEFSQTFTREEKKENNLLTSVINMLIFSLFKSSLRQQRPLILCLCLLFSTCTNPTIHLFNPPKFCITIVCNSSWDIKMCQGKSKTMPMPIFWAVEAVYYGIVQVVNTKKIFNQSASVLS